jgi:hypothetical protein
LKSCQSNAAITILLQYSSKWSLRLQRVEFEEIEEWDLARCATNALQSNQSDLQNMSDKKVNKPPMNSC